jgi:hypothetical protein
MIFKIGFLPEVPEFIPDDNWILVSEPSIWGFQLRAIPIGILTTGIFAFLWITITPVGNISKFMNFPPNIYDFVKNAISVIGIITVLEPIHAFVHPKFGASKKTVINFWPSRMFFCTVYTGEQTKKRC